MNIQKFQKYLQNTAFVQSWKTLDRQFIHVLFLDFIYYLILLFVGSFYAYKILPAFFDLLDTAKLIQKAQTFTSQEQLIATVQTMGDQLTEFKIYSVVIALVLFLNYVVFKYLVWKKIQKKQQSLKELFLSLGNFAVLNICAFAFFILLLVASWYLFVLETFNIIFFFVMPLIVFYTMALLHPLFVMTQSVQKTVSAFVEIGIKKVHCFIFPCIIMILGAFVVMEIVPFLLFLPVAVYFLWYVLCFAAYFCWTKYYVYACIIKIDGKEVIETKIETKFHNKKIKIPLMNKKSQLTVFIILGIFILLGVGLFTYFTSEIYKYRNLPQQFIPVAKYAEQCVQDVTEQAIFQAGMYGGYVSSPYEEKEAYLDAGFPVTYWYLAGEDRSVSIPHLEKEIENYLVENMNSCFADFSTFSQFGITPVSSVPLNAEITIGDDEVSVSFSVPVQISDATTTATLPAIKVEFKNTIGNKLFLANQIMKNENEKGFLEFYTNEIIAASDWLPYEGFDFTCKPKRWTIAEMKKYIQKAVSVNLPFLMFEGTDYKKTGDLYYDNIYKVSLGASGVDDLHVATLYDPHWGMNLDVQPNNNGVVTDIKLVGKTIALPCIHTYHHKYSATYSVMFTITDEDNADFPFYFATPVVMHRNEPDRYNEMQPWPSEVDTTREKAFCSNTTAVTKYTLDEDGIITTKQEEQPNWIYGLDIISQDSQYGFDEVLKDVQISYKCLNFECLVGSTGYGGGTGRHYESSGMLATYPLLSSTFPTCINGQLIAEKQGYHTKKIFQTVSEETDGATILLPMYRLQQLAFTVTVVENHNNVITERSIEKNEMAVITIKNDAEGFEKVIVYPITAELGNEEDVGEEINEETLAAAGFDSFELLVADDITYAVDIKLLQDERYVGSFVYNWTPAANAITAASTVQFYVIKKDVMVPTDENYLEAIEYADKQSSNYPPVLS